MAGEPPIPITPENNSTVSSSKLTWQTPTYSIYSNDPYRIQVDNDSDFSSVYRDYKTKNTFYTPSLSEGTWYWKVKAKDLNGTWSDWSSVWSFTLTNPSPTPSPTTLPSPSPTPTQTPVAATTPSPTTSSFFISNTPTQINYDESFTVSVNLILPNNPVTAYYLAGAFKIDDGTRYFGLTKINSNWVSYSSEDFSKQYKIITDNSGIWSGNLEVKPNITDSDYKGTGDYSFKVVRYTQAGSQTWSNEFSIKIIGLSVPDSSNLSSSKSSPDPTPLPKTPTNKITSTTNHYIKPNPKIASIAGASKIATFSTYPTSSPSSNIKVAQQKQFNPFVLVGIIFIIAGSGSLGYLIIKKKAKI